jgi:tellurite resistance protein TehA-like permease
MGPDASESNGPGVRGLPPDAFAVVMATGIVSLAAGGAGYRVVAGALFGLNVALYAVLLVLLQVRVLRRRAELAADLRSHARAPGFFTLVAAPCVLGDQCVTLADAGTAGLALGIIGAVFWLLLSYAMLPGLMVGANKPRPEEGLSGSWLLAVVGTQAVSALSCRLVAAFPGAAPEGPLLLALALWLVGSMLYFWLITILFHRVLFLPLSPRELTPPYWINMGAMAISTLAGVGLVGAAGRLPLLGELLPFLKGMTLLFWATATWWIPVLLALGVWRHVLARFPLAYEHGYWAAVFPLGMYAACTQYLARVFGLPVLEPLATGFVWVALAAWGATFAGLVLHLVRRRAGS